ncbi:rhomboid family intramembrane serine protease [Bacteroidales bacterium]|nr:rhomboid family intramembrane serine protease [Bacteroidales bacterium]
MTTSQNGFLSSIPPVTKNIIIINFIAWMATLALSTRGIDLINIFGLHYFLAEDFRVYQLVSYLFLHDTSSLSHVFFNMFAVFMFGRVIETSWGSKRFLIYYAFTGIGAGLIQELVWFFEYQSLDPTYFNLPITIGASGAVFGILLAFGMMFPNTPLYIMFIPIPIKAKYFVIGYGLLELYFGVAQRNGDNVAHFAHLGGMLFGIIFILYWRRKDKRNGKHHG